MFVSCIYCIILTEGNYNIFLVIITEDNISMKLKVILQSIALSFIGLAYYSCTGLNEDTVDRIPFVENLIREMSVEEKVGQTAQVTLDAFTKGDNIYTSYEPIELEGALLQKAIHDYHLGSILNTANNKALSVDTWHNLIDSIQSCAAKSATSIPVLYGIDAIHGATYTAGATLFPQQIAQAATWNRDLVYDAARVTAYETRASSIKWTFSPVLDLGRDARWARMWETYGEDPYLCAELGVQAVKGYQGENMNSDSTVAACLKHFVGYASNSGKDRTPVELSNTTLREYYLPAFQASVDAGAASVMINSGIINGVPVHASYEILTELLKNEMGFNGLVVTDWADIENLYNRDKVASSHKEAIKMAINAGIDMSMIPYDYERYCDLFVDLVNEGEISMERLDDAVRRILNLKYRLGLFDDVSNNQNNYSKFGSDDFIAKAYNTAAEAITLLKNTDNILPLKKGVKILVSGPNANSMRTVNGGWSYSWQGEKVELFAQEYNTIFESLQNKFGKDRVQYVAGVEYFMDGVYHNEHNVNIKEAVDAAKDADVIVLCLGENSYTEKPGDLHDLMISENQEELALALAKTGKPMILVLNEGRPRIIRNIEPHVEAVVQTYLSGNFTGDALADILSGDINPSGKLPYTYPMFSNTLVVYNHKPSEESTTPEGMYDYGGGFFPQYEFGFGLSYTSFEYFDFNVSKSEFSKDEDIVVSIKVKNIGEVAGKEVVQLFSRDVFASVTPDVKRLRGFDKVELAPGQEKEVVFTLNAKDLSFINSKGERVTESGEFVLMIDDLSASIRLK